MMLVLEGFWTLLAFVWTLTYREIEERERDREKGSDGVIIRINLRMNE